MRASRITVLIGGPRTFSWQGATWVFLISVAIGFRLNYQPGVTDGTLLAAVMASIAGITVATYAILAVGYILLNNPWIRVTYALTGFVVVIVVRAKVADVLLQEWGLADGSRFSWRVQQVFAFGITSLLVIAMTLNALHESKSKIAELTALHQSETNTFNEVLQNLSEQRIYTIHEMSIESANAQELVREIDEQLPIHHPAREEFADIEKNVDFIVELLARARQLTPTAIEPAVIGLRPTWVQRVLPIFTSYQKDLQRKIAEIISRREQLEEMAASENRLWKQTFVSDISRSPTTATILLRSIAENPNAESTSDQMQRVAKVWKSVVEDSVASMANSSRLRTSGRLEP